VLLRCRRRCAICFGLSRDTTIKRGQIAHLDQDSSNSTLDNLVFLCLECHDQYDGRTSQSKGLTASETKRFREELHEAIATEWNAPISFGGGEPPAYPLAGHYVREGINEEAELDVTELPDGRVRVEGFALWGTTRPLGPNIGDVTFEAPVSSGSTSFEQSSAYGHYRLELSFGSSGLVAKEFGKRPFGMNVSFGGEYSRVSSSSTS